MCSVYLLEPNLDFNLMESFKFNNPIPIGDDISGNNDRALIILGGIEEPFLTSLNLTNLIQISFGVLGTGELGFQ